MPITKAAKKAMRQTQTRTERNKGTRTVVKTYMRKVLELSKSDPAKAEEVLPKAYKVIDIAAKKNILHDKTAARRKSRLARAVAVGKNSPKSSGSSAKSAKKAAPKVEAKAADKSSAKEDAKK